MNMAMIQTTMDKKHALHKKTYIKPAMKVVQLVAEEAVLGTCKDGTGTMGGLALCEPTERCKPGFAASS